MTSSSKFEAVLNIDPRLRRLVMLSSAVSTLLGFALIIQMQLSVVVHVVMAIAWLVLSVAEIWRWADSALRVDRWCLTTESVWVAGRDGAWVEVTLLPGSIVLQRLAWFRVCSKNGRKFSELLAGNAVKDPDWHRLQLIWRQRKLAVGDTGRS